MLCLKLTTKSLKTLPFSNNSNHQCKYITYFFIISKLLIRVKCFYLRIIQFFWMDNTLYSFLLIPQYITQDKPEHKIIFMRWIIYTKVYIEVHMYWGQKPISDALYQKDFNLFAPWWKESLQMSDNCCQSSLAHIIPLSTINSWWLSWKKKKSSWSQ